MKAKKQQAIPLQGLTGPEVSRRLRGSHISRQSAQKVDKVVSSTHWPPLLARI
jgi:hypothetical protein